MSMATCVIYDILYVYLNWWYKFISLAMVMVVTSCYMFFVPISWILYYFDIHLFYSYYELYQLIFSMSFVCSMLVSITSERINVQLPENLHITHILMYGQTMVLLYYYFCYISSV